MHSRGRPHTCHSLTLLHPGPVSFPCGLFVVAVSYTSHVFHGRRQDESSRGNLVHGFVATQLAV